MLGFNCPNAQWRRWTPAEIAGMAMLRPAAILVYAYAEHPVLYHDSLSGLINSLGYRPRVLVRPYAERVLEWSPADWAREAMDRASALCQGIAADYELIPANELNLPLEAGSEELAADFPQQADWLQAVAYYIRSLNGFQGILHLPAPSAIPSRHPWWEYMAEAGVGDLYQRIDLHAYAVPLEAQGDLAFVRGLFAKPVDITEYNRLSHGWIGSQVAPGAALYFIYNTDDPNANTDPGWPTLYGQPEYEAFLAASHAVNNGGVIPPDPPAPPDPPPAGGPPDWYGWIEGDLHGLWAVANEVERTSYKRRAELAHRIRAHVVSIKRTAGLE